MQPHHPNRVSFARYHMIMTLAGSFNENERMHRLIHVNHLNYSRAELVRQDFGQQDAVIGVHGLGLGLTGDGYWLPIKICKDRFSPVVDLPQNQRQGPKTRDKVNFVGSSQPKFCACSMWVSSWWLYFLTFPCDNRIHFDLITRLLRKSWFWIGKPDSSSS